MSSLEILRGAPQQPIPIESEQHFVQFLPINTPLQSGYNTRNSIEDMIRINRADAARNAIKDITSQQVAHMLIESPKVLDLSQMASREHSRQ